MTRATIFDGVALGTGLIAVKAGAAAMGAAAGLAVAGPFILTGLAIMATLQVARSTSERLYTDMDHTSRRVDKGLEDTAKALADLKPQIKTMKETREKLGYEMVQDAKRLRDLKKQVAGITNAAKKEPKLKKSAEDAQKKIAALEKAMIKKKEARDTYKRATEALDALIAESASVSQRFKSNTRSIYGNILRAGKEEREAVEGLSNIFGSLKKVLK